ncbi:MAG: shikimate dehydrogenase [Desulfotomaculales bacterium]
MQVDAATRVCGLIGYPVGHSFSPAMHNAALRALGINWLYVAFAVRPAHLPAAVAAVRALDMPGANVTIPHKEAVLPLVDEVSDAARLAGAVNTIVLRDGMLFGDNTDGRGFLRAVAEAGFDPRGKTVVIIGAGGAARAVGTALAGAGVARFVLINRTVERARALGDLLASLGPEVCVFPWSELARPPAALATFFEEAGLVVQTTSLGMHPAANLSVPIAPALFHRDQLVCDLVYNPPLTRFLKLAQAAGAGILNGLGMLLHQGALALEAWTGRPAPVEVMRAALARQVAGGGE